MMSVRASSPDSRERAENGAEGIVAAAHRGVIEREFAADFAGSSGRKAGTVISAAV
jgi:hypothetical protein